MTAPSCEPRLLIDACPNFLRPAAPLAGRRTRVLKHPRQTSTTKRVSCQSDHWPMSGYTFDPAQTSHAQCGGSRCRHRTGHVVPPHGIAHDQETFTVRPGCLPGPAGCARERQSTEIAAPWILVSACGV